MNIGDRIKLVRGRLSQEEFAASIESSKAAVGAYERGKQSPGSGVIISICQQYGVKPDWLLFGNGPMYDEARIAVEPARAGLLRAGAPIATLKVKTVLEAPSQAHRPQTIECEDCEIMMLPMVEARLSAGMGSFETSEGVERRYAFRTDFLMRKGQPSQMVLMRVDGDSMQPSIVNGDVVLIDQSQREPRAGKVYAVGVEDVVYLKQVNAVPGKIILSSYNPDYPPIEVDARGDLSNGIRIIGRAVWVGRELN